MWPESLLLCSYFMFPHLILVAICMCEFERLLICKIYKSMHILFLLFLVCYLCSTVIKKKNSCGCRTVALINGIVTLGVVVTVMSRDSSGKATTAIQRL